MLLKSGLCYCLLKKWLNIQPGLLTLLHPKFPSTVTRAPSELFKELEKYLAAF